MKTRLILISFSILLVFIYGCVSPANQDMVNSAGLYHDREGLEPTNIYDARAVFYCVVILDEPIPDSTLRASWVAVDTNRLAPNSVLKIDEVTPTSSSVVFELQNQGNFWPTGSYRVFLYLDGKEIKAIDFEVFHDYFPE